MPITVTELGIINSPDKPLQLEKAELPIEVTELGMNEFLQPRINSFVLVLMRALQLSLESKKMLPIPTEIVSKLKQPLKALWPIEVTEFPMDNDVKPRQLKKACWPNEVTEFPMIKLPVNQQY